jgi:hypothetical protein
VTCPVIDRVTTSPATWREVVEGAPEPVDGDGRFS